MEPGVLDEDDKELVGVWIQEQSAGFDFDTKASCRGVSQTMRSVVSVLRNYFMELEYVSGNFNLITSVSFCLPNSKFCQMSSQRKCVLLLLVCQKVLNLCNIESKLKSQILHI